VGLGVPRFFVPVSDAVMLWIAVRSGLRPDIALSVTSRMS
jgi:hypothetical protein